MGDLKAILIEPDGEITTPHFAGVAAPDHPGGWLWYLRGRIDSAAPNAVEVPNSSGLVFWTDGRAFVRMRYANRIGSAVFAHALSLPLQIICGPLLITGGSPEEPQALTAAQVIEAFEHLNLERADEAIEG